MFEDCVAYGLILGQTWRSMSSALSNLSWVRMKIASDSAYHLMAWLIAKSRATNNTKMNRYLIIIS